MLGPSIKPLFGEKMRLYLTKNLYEFEYFVESKIQNRISTNPKKGYSFLDFIDNDLEDILDLFKTFSQGFPYSPEIVKVSDDVAVIVYDKITNNVAFSKDLKSLRCYEQLPNMIVSRDYSSFLLYDLVLPSVLIPIKGTSERHPKDIPFSFRKLENIFSIDYVIDEYLLKNLASDNGISEYIYTPLFSLIKNKDGIGNSILFNGDILDESCPGRKTIYEVLGEDIFWEQVILPLLTGDFYELKEELENQKPSLDLELKMFNLNLHKNSLDRIKNSEATLNTILLDISNRENIIRELKISAARLKEDLKESKKIAADKLGIRKLKDDINTIKAMPYISDVFFSGSTVHFITEPIQIDDGPFLGGYDIAYNIINNKLRVVNTVNPMNGCEHPHIQHGTICYGNYSDVESYFATGNFYVGIEMLHEFLSTYNAEDEWGDALIYWDAEYAFRNIEDLGTLSNISYTYDSYYFDIYGEHLPQASICEICGCVESECECHICPYCGEREEYCTCWICSECGCKVGYDCNCYRCVRCEELLEDCVCERCEICGGLIDLDDYFNGDNCTCVRCPLDYDTLVDEESVCSECEEFDCEYNANENQATTQEESLF